MAGLGTIITAFQRTTIDSPTSNTSSGTMSTSMSHSTSHSTHSRTNSASSHSHYGNGSLHWEGSKHGSVDTLNISIPDEFEFAERYSRLVELEKIPWNEQLVGRVLRNSEKVCQLVDRIPQSVVQRLSFLMQRPFVRVVREVKRLSTDYAKCTKHEIQTAVKLVMAPSLADACMNAAVKALSLYQMSSEQMRRGKTARAGLTFPIGRFFRWLAEARISSRVEDHAALYLAASMEALASELFFRACAPYFEKTDGELTQAVLDYGIANEAELWGMLQPYEHLICGRNSSGTVILPHEVSNNSGCSNKLDDPLEISRSLEQSLMVTCVGSIAELGDLVDRAMHFHQSRSRTTNSPYKTNGITWSPDGLRTLFHFMSCNQLEYQDDRPIVQLTPERPYVVLPPLMEWIRVANTHCEHRLSSVVDSDDVRQAARLLLPGIDTPVRPLRMDESLCSSRHLDASQSTARFQQDLGFRMLACGRTDLVPNAAALLGPDGIDTVSEQGMTALMLACARGDEAMVQILLDNGAKPNLTVPSSHQKYPCIHPTIRHWTALSFAVAHRHTAIAQLLLDAGANVEGAHGENYTHSPLQLASAAGYHELVCLLLDKGADPYLTTLHRNGITSKGHGNSFALAAAHGHRNILRKLLEQPRLIRSSDILSLEEILAEGSDGPKERKASKARKNKIALMLQEAMYHSCEHGFLDIAMELRSLGVPWTFHCWLETLRTAKYFHRLAIIQCLFRDFGSIPVEDDYEELIRDGLPLMFEIFRQSKNDLVSKQLANIFPLLMGTDKISDIPTPDAMHGARIDPQYINNPEMSDVTFVVEGRRFYAHKIVLVTASKRFKAMLSDRMLDPQKPIVEITEFSYHIFQLLMQYLYNGSTENLHVKPSELPELLAAANHFVLSGLQLHCERLLSIDLAWDNATTVYRQARLYGAESLLEYCHWFFLLNMPELLAKNETFKKLIFPPKQHPYDLPSMLQDTLAKQIFNRFTKQTTV